MKRFLLLLVMAVAAITGVNAQDKYQGQPLVFHLASGDSLTYELWQDGLYPRLENGEVVWHIGNPQFPSVENGEVVWRTNPDRPYGVENVERIDFLTPDQSLARAREGLMELYKATDGDHWDNKTNWGSDKPISEWFGVTTTGRPYVTILSLENNGLKGKLPNRGAFAKMGPTDFYGLWENQLSGPIPEDWTNNLSLWAIMADNNELSSALPAKLLDLPSFGRLEITNNKFTGSIPAGIARLMDNQNMLNISNNDFSGDVPEEIVSHPRFHLCWDQIIPQQGHLNVPTIPGYRFPVTDLSGNQLETTDVYKNNLYTLIFNYSSAQDEFTSKLKLAYEQYKNKGFEVLGMAPGDAEAVNEYLHENGIDWLNLDPKSFGDYFGFYYAYLNFLNLVDQNGNIVFTSIMDENGKMEDTGWMGSTRDQQVFDVLAEKFGSVDFTPYASTDYSRDGEVITLQKATVGKGIDIVFVGNCFVDKDMEPGGKYEQKMQQAMEQFFAYEPYTSLRNRFNVYAVKAVSQNAEMYEGTKRAINSDADAFAYAQKIPDLIPDRPMRVNIVYNSLNAGRSFTFMYDDNSYSAFMFTGVNRVLNHEGGGHGIGRLYDEYVEDAGSTASNEIKDYYERMWTENGRGANIDMHADVTQTRWARFAADPRYAAEELGAYEGSGTFNYGIYRPTQNSMMRFNDMPFNAPSREAIYKYVMQESEGASWKYDYETFVAFDAAGRAEFANAVEKAASARQRTGAEGKTPQPSEVKQKQPLPPVIKSGSWRDALEHPTLLK